MTKTEKEIIKLIRLGKKKGDMKLKNYARKALFALQSNDGTPGLGSYLWEEEVSLNLLLARERAALHSSKICCNYDCAMNICGKCYDETIMGKISGENVCLQQWV